MIKEATILKRDSLGRDGSSCEARGDSTEASNAKSK